MPRISVELTEDEHRRFVNAKLDRKLRSLQALMIEATEASIAGESRETQRPKASQAHHDVLKLTDDERDVLEMLRHAPTMDFPYPNILEMVTRGLEKYREEQRSAVQPKVTRHERKTRKA